MRSCGLLLVLVACGSNAAPPPPAAPPAVAAPPAPPPAAPLLAEGTPLVAPTAAAMPPPPADPAVDLIAFSSTTCAVLASGAVACWGGGDAEHAGPHRLAGVTDAAAVAISYHHVCVLHRDGSVGCADTEPTDPAPPLVPVTGAKGVVEIAINGDAVCVRERAGTVACWVSGGTGAPAFTRVRGLSGARTLAMGTQINEEWQFPLVSFACAIVDRGAVQCFDLYRQAELEPADPRQPYDEFLAHRGVPPAQHIQRLHALHGIIGATELLVPNAANDKLCVRAGAGPYNCVETAARDPHDGAPDDSGPIADSITYLAWSGSCIARLDGVTCEHPFSKPAAVSVPGLVKLVDAYDHACALVEHGRVVCWGSDEAAGLGLPHVPQTAVGDVLGLTDAVDLASWRTGTLALRSNGQLVFWGHDSDGDFDRPTTFSKLTDVVKLAGGGTHVCALRAGGKVSCWGGGGATKTPNWMFGDEPHELPGVTGARDVKLTEGGAIITQADGTLLHIGDIWNGGRREHEQAAPLTEAPRAVEAVVANRWLCTRDATPGPVTCRCQTKDWDAPPVVVDVPDVVEMAAAGARNETSAPKSLTEGDPDLRYPTAFLALRRASGAVVSVVLTIDGGTAHASTVPFASFTATHVFAHDLALCAVGDGGTIVCHSDETDQWIPPAVPAELGGSRAITVGNPTCGLRANGHVACTAGDDAVTAGRGMGRSDAPVPVEL